MTDEKSISDKQPDHLELPPDRWETFTRWHRDPNLYREIYARSLATLIAAFVVYVVAALSGFVSNRPVLIIFIGVGAVGAISFLVTLLDVIRYRKDVLPLFRGAGWPPVKTREELVYRRTYTRLVVSSVLALFLVIPIELWAVAS